jgi:fluoroquinolone transport system ATP-binding protein
MTTMIEVESLRFRYPRQDADTICGISFKLAAGEIFGFLGPSGSGKSTTQKLLIGLLRNYSGQLRILGKSASDWRHDLYQHIGVGFELPNHFSKLTGLENLELFASFYGAAAQTQSPAQLLEMVDLAASARQRVSEYSKGMKMRLNFARALLNDPQLLFLDEPTAGLDPVTARRIKDIIKDLQSKGKTIFLTTHNMHDAEELCDRVAFIVAGNLKLVGAPKSLKSEYGQQSVRVETLAGDKAEVGTSACREFPLDRLGENAEFLELIKQETVSSIHSQEATLEEVFIKTTGAQLT